MPRTLHIPRLSRKVVDSWPVVNVRSPEEVDDELLDWLAEAYFASPE
jgi:hypothetical protein